MIKRLTIPRWMRRRLTLMAMVVCAAIVINFAIPRMMPGDVTTAYISDLMSPETVEVIRRQFGLDQSWVTQFWLYLKNTFTFQFGMSFVYRTQSVASMISEAVPRTLLLLIPAQLIQVLISYILGVIAGWKAGTKKDSLLIGGGLILWAMPVFWVAMVILYFGAFQFGWFPIGGYKSVGVQLNWFQMIFDRIYHMILPILTMATQFGNGELVMRNTMTITLKQNYVMTARAKGLSENRVKYRHAARNAMIPLVTSTTMRIANAVGGMIFIEKIFSYPGMGKLIFDAVVNQDYPVLQTAFLMTTIVTLSAIFALDLIYARLDPRVRYE